MFGLRTLAGIVVVMVSCGLAKAGDLYTSTTYGNVHAAYLAAMLSTDYIQANEDSTNGVPVGTVLVYRTGRGFFGKMRIDTCTTARLVFTYTTWSDSASIESHDSLAVVQGTWSYDLDRDVEGTDTACDFFWSIWDATPPATRAFTPQNGGEFAAWTGTTGVMPHSAGHTPGVEPAGSRAVRSTPTTRLAFVNVAGLTAAAFDLRGRALASRPLGQSPELLLIK